MKRWFLRVALPVMMWSVANLAAASPPVPPASPPPSFAPHRLIVKLKPSLSAAEQASVRADFSARLTGRLDGIGAEVWHVDATAVDDAVKRLSNDPRVEFAEPDYVIHALDLFPNDPQFGQEWFLYNSGQPVGRSDADIDAPEAWSTSSGAPVLVAVIDTGIDLDHEDLISTVYTNPGEIAGNHLDDDGNGFVDDVHGWDFLNNDNDPDDDNGHGSHVSGLIAARGNNGVGVAGVCWSARVLPLKFLDERGSGATSDAILAIEYAVRMGARVINNSWGSIVYSSALRAAFAQAGVQGVLCVTASGNGGLDTDYFPAYPADYDLDNIVSVTSTDRSDALPWFASFGKESVDLAAPGYDILSTFPGNRYVSQSGTSMSCAIVTGAACLLWSRAPLMTDLDVKAALLASVDRIPSQQGITRSGGRLNVQKLIAGLDRIPPAPVVDLSVESTSSSAVRLAWTATGDDGSTGTAARYELRYSTSPINTGNIAVAIQALNLPRPLGPGSAERFEVGGLSFVQRYYFAVSVLDEAGNRSSLSNVASGVTLAPPQLDYTPDVFYAALLTGASTTRTLTITNRGGGTLDYSSPGSPPWARIDPEAGRLAAGESRAVHVIFDATQKTKGRYDTSLILITNDPLQFSVPLSVHLDVSDAPDIAVSTASLDVGNAFPGTCVHRSMKVTNRGTLTLSVGAIEMTEPPFVVVANGIVLAPGESYDIPVNFCPPSRSKWTGTFAIQSNDPDHPVITIQVLGRGVDPPSASAAPPSLSVSLNPGGATKRTISVSNAGGSNLDYVLSVVPPTSPSASAGTAGASTTSDDLAGVGRPFSKNEIERLRAASIPTQLAIGPNGRLDAGASPAVHAERAPSPTSSNRFAEVFGGDEAGFFGDGLMRGNFFKCTRTTNLKEYRFYLNPIASTQIWFVVYEGATQEGFYNLVGISDLAPSASGPGWYSSGDINVLMTSNRYYLMVATWVGNTGYFLQHVTSAYPIPASFGSLIAGAGYSWGPWITFPPFPRQLVDSDAFGPKVAYYQTVITDGVIPWLSAPEQTGTVAREGSVPVELDFDAAGMRAGDYDAKVRIVSNAPASPTIVVPVHLHVNSAPDIALPAGPLDLGECLIGASTADTFLIANRGTEYLNVSHVAVNGAGFAATPASFNLAPNEIAQLTVTFNPATTGTHTGSLVVDSDDPDEPSLTLELSATGRQPPHAALPVQNAGATARPGARVTSLLPIVNSGGGALSYELVIERAPPPAGATGGTKIVPRDGGGGDPLPAASAPRGRSYSSHRTGGRSRSVVPARRVTPAPHTLRVFTLRTGGVEEILSEFIEDTDIDFTGGIDGETQTPSLTDLLAYDVVFVVNDFTFADPVAIGDVLADYVDHGGAVVMTLAAFVNGYDVRGRFMDQGYSPFVVGPGPLGSASLGNYDAAHPIMAGAGFAFADQLGGVTLAAGAQPVAEWNNGLPFIATRKAGRVVGMNIFLGDGGFWDGDITLMLRNAFFWASGAPWLRASPQRGVVAPHQEMNAILTFDATELPVGTYSALLRVAHNEPLAQPVEIPVTLTVDSTTVVTGVGELPLPERYSLSPNRPNPFNPVTTIAYDLPHAGESRLVIYDVSGARVRELVRQREPAGRYTVMWDGRNDAGQPVASGVYFYRLSSGTFTQTRKMVLLK